jgi:hypothetical protein
LTMLKPLHIWFKSFGFGFGSVLDPDSIRSVDPDPDPYSESGSVSNEYRSKTLLKTSCYTLTKNDDQIV